jgi:hypothetical protein
MIKHIVFFKFQENIKENQLLLKQKLDNLKDKIPQIIDYEVGINIVDTQRAYDVSLISSFSTKDDLKQYAINPLHLEVIDFIKSINTITKVVDYEI